MSRSVSVVVSTLALLVILPASVSAQGYGQDVQQPDQQQEQRRQRGSQQQGYEQPQHTEPSPEALWFADRGRVLVGPLFGLGGEFEGEISSPDTDQDMNADDDMLNTIGAFAQYEVPVHPHVVVGARGAFGGFLTEEQDDSDIGRDLFFNVDAIAKLRYAFKSSPGELYFGMPVGVSVLLPSGDWEDETTLEWDTGFSWNMSLVGGLNYLLFGDFGLFVEGGWMLQNISWGGELFNEAGTDSIDVDYEGSFTQFGLNLGITIPL